MLRVIAMGKMDSAKEQLGSPKENLAPGMRVGFWSAPRILTEGCERWAYLIQGEVWLFNFSQGVSKEAEHELLHLKPVNSPQLLVGVGWGGAHERPPVMSPTPLSQAPWPSPTQPYPLVLEEELLELRKGHTTELWPLPSPVGKKGSTWQPGGWRSP